MGYDKIAELCGQLSYRDKFRLAQLLIQVARKEEEEKKPDGRTPAIGDFHTIEYVAERLMKSKPAKKAALLNFIGAMFQFQGGISDEDKETIVSELQKKKWLNIDSNDRVSYKT
ncbi:hypothetical protein [Candidatus Contendibacter odensensis]|uniref:Integron gene cassette protein n=1 Tax=Candidatus Contendobacter odensis Run_B_J11 TaxID=1400861 RepID=A0A7U7G849_9GAMM|nr:hypothetical protein [Candidatus Contendobacter odensis]CDH43255.1 putative integron gene cassette protein [Candidatus Contendobacter odensis Run_B_J11]